MNKCYTVRCEKCKVYHNVIDAIEHGCPSACRWFIDNVVCGDESSTDNCPDFEPLEDENNG